YGSDLPARADFYVFVMSASKTSEDFRQAASTLSIATVPIVYGSQLLKPGWAVWIIRARVDRRCASTPARTGFSVMKSGRWRRTAQATYMQELRAALTGSIRRTAESHGIP